MQKKRPPIHLEIPRRGRHCVVGQEEFVADMSYYSRLFEDAEQGYVRQDFCAACWEKTDKIQGAPSWKARVPLKSENLSTAHLQREDKAMSLFREVLEQGEAADTVILFVLALYLARRKILALRQQVEENGKTYFLYEVVETEEMIPVEKVNLTKMKGRIEQVQQELAQQL